MIKALKAFQRQHHHRPRKAKYEMDMTTGPLLPKVLSFSLPLYAEEGKTSLTVAIGCTGGHHRSVAVTHALTEQIRAQGYSVTENHRDINRNS